MARVNGLHHITAIAGPAQENLDFYAGVLGMRLVKKSVNQDDPGTYHLFYADAEGHPGTDLTFFPWAQLAPPRTVTDWPSKSRWRCPRGSLTFWGARLEKYGAQIEPIETRFGERVLPVVDPHGLRVELVEAATPRRQFTPWDGGPVRRRASDSRTARRPLVGARARADGDVPDRARLASSALGDRRRLDALRVQGRGRASSICAKRPRRGAAPGASAACTISPGGWTTRRTSCAVRTQVEAAGAHADAGDRSVLVQVGVLQGAGRRAVRAGDRWPGLRGGRGPGASRRVARAAAVARVVAPADRGGAARAERTGGARVVTDTRTCTDAGQRSTDTNSPELSRQTVLRWPRGGGTKCRRERERPPSSAKSVTHNVFQSRIV